MTVVLAITMVLLVITVELLRQAYRRRKARAPAAVKARPLEPMRPPFVPYGVFLAPSHSWAAFGHDGTFRVGLDNFLCEALGSVDTIELPRVGSALARSDALASLTIGGKRLAVPAPVAGEVVAVNDAACCDPSGLVADPYRQGWLLKLRPSDEKAALEPLYVGKGAVAFLKREHRRLVDLISFALSPPAAPQLADGGQVQRGAVAELPPAAFALFARDFVGERSISSGPYELPVN